VEEFSRPGGLCSRSGKPHHMFGGLIFWLRLSGDDGVTQRVSFHSTLFSLSAGAVPLGTWGSPSTERDRVTCFSKGKSDVGDKAPKSNRPTDDGLRLLLFFLLGQLDAWRRVFASPIAQNAGSENGSFGGAAGAIVQQKRNKKQPCHPLDLSTPLSAGHRRSPL